MYSTIVAGSTGNEKPPVVTRLTTYAYALPCLALLLFLCASICPRYLPVT